MTIILFQGPKTDPRLECPLNGQVFEDSDVQKETEEIPATSVSFPKHYYLKDQQIFKDLHLYKAILYSDYLSFNIANKADDFVTNYDQIKKCKMLSQM